MRGRNRTRSTGRKELPPGEAGSDRLHKVLAGSGLGSRRALEKQIAAGAVQVNGKTAGLGLSVRPGDRIQFLDRDWKVVAETAQHRTLIYNKPEGELTTRADPEGRPTVFDRMPWLKDARWVAVGRLDINTTGLLLLTTDGELANAMMHPSNRVDREYVCRIRGLVSDEQLERLRQGVMLEDGPARFSDIQRMASSTGGNQWFQVTLLEGRNREVRRLWEAVGCMVSRLKRVRYGAAKLPRGLRVGHFSEIQPREHAILRRDVNLPVAVERLTLQELKARGTPTGKSTRKAPGRHGKAGSGKATATAKVRPEAASHQKFPQAGARPGSPAGSGRRPHPRSRKARDK